MSNGIGPPTRRGATTAGFILLATLYAFAPVAQATTIWHLTYTANVSEWGEGPVAPMTFDFVWNPADIYDPCAPPQDDPNNVTCAAGDGIVLSFFIRTSFGSVIIHDGMLIPPFWFAPYAYDASDRPLDIKGAGWGWPNPAVGRLTVSPVPEPGTLALFGFGLMGLRCTRRPAKGSTRCR
jgi:hypothetical protein